MRCMNLKGQGQLYNDSDWDIIFDKIHHGHQGKTLIKPGLL